VTEPAITLIVPFYRNVEMLKRQSAEWNSYPSDMKIIVVDDCSPEPAEPLVERRDITILRITDDIKWNRNGARNLGAHVADTEWIMQIDIDHLLPARAANSLTFIANKLSPLHMYRFPRFRRGAADETRMKDRIPRGMTYGKIKPHGDSYLCTKAAYWKAGGYNYAFSGHLGGGSPFLAQLERVAKLHMLPHSINLEVFTKSECSDASDTTLSRDQSHYIATKKRLEREGKIKGDGDTGIFPFSYERVQ
jgi:hypothetical protein